MKILIACEFSGIVRDAFAARGHDAWSCDIIPSERPGNHFQGTILDVNIIQRGWDLMIAHPDCTFLTVSGARWFSIGWRREAQLSAIHFVKALWDFPINKIVIENPIGVLSTVWKKPTQIIQPWQFGEPETKATCLWLKNTPPLVTTQVVEGINHRVHQEPPGPDRKKNRSRTFQGIASAMAEQWG